MAIRQELGSSGYYKMRNLVILFLIPFLNEVHGQKYDYHWILGNYDANIDILFTDTSADTIRTIRGADMENSQTTISDSAGNLLFFTNGARIYNRDNDTMQNGDSLNYGAYWDQYEDGISYDELEEIVGLPTDTPAVWNLIHYYTEYTFNQPFLFDWRIYESRVDMRGDNGLGKVVFKNKLLVQDTIGSYVTACQHGNGRDWWVLASQTSSNCLYTLLVEPDTVIQYPLQCLGHNYTSEDAGQAAFSPDGTKFAWVGGYDGINIYDFDRCTGLLSNPINLPFVYPDDSVLEYGLAISPNSRYLYIAQDMYVLQFDLQASNILASLDTVGRLTPPPDTNSYQAPYFLMQLGADGKIYISTFNTVKWLHVINFPDKQGDSCGFQNYGFTLPYSSTFGLPSYPGNYRLGAWQGSPCDTLTSITELQRTAKEKILKIYPNPTTDYTVIDYGYTDWSKGEVQLQICNDLGQTIYTQQLPMYSGFQKIDVSSFASGMYTVFIKRNNGVVASGKVVKI